MGGGHVSVWLLLQNLDRRRFRPIVAVYGDGPVRRWLEKLAGDQEIEDLPGCVRDRRRVRIGDVATICRRSWALARFLREREVAIVDVNDTIMLGTWILAARLAGARLLWHKRGPWSGRWLHRLWARAADHVIAISAFAAPPEPLPKYSRIYNPAGLDLEGIDRATSRRLLLEETGLASRIRAIGFFADCDKERKRPQVFLETIAAVAEIAPRIAVAGLLFGHASNATETRLREHAERLGIADKVRFMGFRYPPGPWLAACDLLVAPSVDEGFGRTLVEAMLVGTVVVAADSGGHREVISNGETGFLVRPDDPRALAERVAGLLASPDELAAIARRARADALERFGTRRHVAAVAAVYERLLRRAWPTGGAGLNSGQVQRPPATVDC